MPEPAVAAPTRFELELQPDSPSQRWRATLRAAGSDEVVQFDSPLALARHLARLTFDATAAPHRRGLR